MNFVGVSLVLLVLCSVASSEIQRGFLSVPCQVYGCFDAGAECDQESGLCTGCATSPSAVQGVDYQCTPTPDPAPTSCTCTNEQTIRNTGDTANVCTEDNKCLCKLGFTGDDCADNRVKITCTTDQMELLVTPYTYPGATPMGFRGKMYVKTDTDFTESNLQNIPNACKTSAGQPTLDLTLSAAGACQALEISTGDAGEDYTFIYIQHDPDVRSIHDQVVRASCFTGTDAITNSIFTVEDLDVNTLTPIDGTVATSDSITNLQVSLKHDNGDDNWSGITDNSVLRVGDKISLVVERANTELFQVVRCKAQNYPFDEDNEANLNYRSLTFVDGGCIPREAAHLFRGPVVFSTGADGPEAASLGGLTLDAEVMRFDIRAFYFLGASKKIYISCLVAADATAYPAANTVDCPNKLMDPPTTNWVDYVNRRRRDTSQQAEAASELQLYITVYDTEENPFRDGCAGQGTSFERSCYKSTSVLLPIILLAALLLVTMVMTFFFCMKVTLFQDQQQKMSHDNMSYKS